MTLFVNQVMVYPTLDFIFYSVLDQMRKLVTVLNIMNIYTNIVG